MVDERLYPGHLRGHKPKFLNPVRRLPYLVHLSVT